LLICCGILFPVLGVAQDRESYQLQDGQSVAPLEHFRECDFCPEVVMIPLGSFIMGASDGEPWSSIWDVEKARSIAQEGPDGLYNIPHEGPQKSVLMDTPYAIGVNEMTHAEWMICVREGDCNHDPQHSAHPNLKVPLVC
jgi:formylglycine-generating enzyme required for sulfatase activity